MTEKIMIDGVDVSRCGFFGTTFKFNCLMYCSACKDKQNCYYKQLARKTEECERMKKALSKIRDYELDSFDVEWDEYEIERSSTEYSPIIDYVEVGLGEVEDENL